MSTNLRDARRLHRALDGAAEELDLPLTTRQVRALAEVTSRRLAASESRPKEHAAPTLLVKFEAEVLAAVAAGCENAQIAAELGCPFGTVQSAVRRVLVKLNAPSRAGAAVAGLLGGHITAEQVAAAPQPTKTTVTASFSEAS